MSKQFKPEDVDSFMKRFVLLIVVLIIILLSPLAFYAWYLDNRMQNFQDTLRFRPTDEMTASEMVTVKGHYNISNPVSGQLVYVPAYSHVYHNSGDPHLVTITLSIRNTSIDSPIIVNSVRYFDTAGKVVKSFFADPLSIPALGTKEILVEREDTSGGSGANFLVEWVANQTVSQPVIEAVMIDTSSQQGISFARGGTIIGELIPEQATSAETPISTESENESE
ncbi:hypothetical protein Pla110_12830 [Polystyrenella longa]|uniref:DUF3124 domain-containing protein n=1 Tax=Polystyrenella longa TaxID=2528007 RepID=A0A518CK19_9PLAN|nr:DUF3124 domain-containing protein [Polystyrenella longa]QDU79572.1 hypothetical protein Pla110_12830 [Polystyrenella longa]